MNDCPLCERSGIILSDHHLVPRCRGGTGEDKVTICRDCHDALHALFSNKELESTYNSVDALMTHDGYAKMVKFISKQKGKVSTKLSNNQRRRGRNG